MARTSQRNVKAAAAVKVVEKVKAPVKKIKKTRTMKATLKDAK